MDGSLSQKEFVYGLEFITNSQGDLFGVGSQVEPAPSVLEIPSGMWARLPLSFVELASNRDVI